MENLMFNYRDIAKAMRLGWSSRKLAISFKGIISAWAVYILFAYSALMLDNSIRSQGLIALFRDYEFFPCICASNFSPLTVFIWIAGIILSVAMLLQTATTVGRLTFQDLRGHDVYQAKEARAFTAGIRKNILIAASLPFGITIAMFLPIIVIGLIGRIPIVGPLFFSIASLPLLLWGILTLFVACIALFGLAMIPAIAAVTGDDVLEIVIELFSPLFKRPIVTVVHETLAKLTALLSAALLALLSLAAFIMLLVLTEITMGYTFSEILTVALYRIPSLMECPDSVTALFLAGYYLKTAFIVDTTACSPAVYAAGWILGMSLLALLTLIASYLLSVFYSAQVLIYLSFKNKLSGEDMRLKDDIQDFKPEKIN